MTDKKNILQFKVSSALKNIIGRDLITDDFIAVFELIKNSFDANAKNVEVRFENDKLVIIDDGKGMSYPDLTDKWLFVAYSAKKDGTEDNALEDYRNEISQKRHYAGAKGVGRFSCDRLGSYLKLLTRSQAADSAIHELKIDWGEFELDSEQEFENIDINYLELAETEYNLTHGTILEISSLRSEWTRDKILSLKHSLEKLIHPYEGNSAQEFSIYIKAMHELAEDQATKDPRKIINGPVRNFIFEQLSIKTTQVIVRISENGKLLTTELIDRGSTVYKIEEGLSSEYPELKDIRFQLFYLNRAAKTTFAKAMQIRSLDFGSIFLYKNGFRVYPYGEVGEDNFRIDQRHAQGWSRTLGLRDLIGRIEIFGDNDQFTETTSRDGGLIDTPAYRQLVSCFLEKCFQRLEKYVVGIQWPVKDTLDNLSLIDNPSSRALIADLITKLVDSENTRLLFYNKDFLSIINEKAKDAFPALSALRKLANITNDSTLLIELQNTENEYKRLIALEEDSRKKVEAEAAARRKAEEERAKAEEEKAKIQEAYLTERQKNLFFNATSHNNNAVLGLIHHIKLTSNALDTRVQILIQDIRDGNYNSLNFLQILSEIQLISGKILKVSELITVSDLNFKYAKHDGDLIRFIKEYVTEISSLGDEIKISLDIISGEKPFNFSPLEVTIIFDNLISNAVKAGAHKMVINIPSINPLIIQVSDDGDGVNKEWQDKIFDLGFTKTNQGSGIGLANIKDILAGMKGEIRFKGNGILLKGACFEIEI